MGRDMGRTERRLNRAWGCESTQLVWRTERSLIWKKYSVKYKYWMELEKGSGTMLC